MAPNLLLTRLGLSKNTRAVIIHADDVGMCHASVQAFQELWEFGTITSGAVMTPCAWFPAAAQLCRDNPGVDMGVHATLNSEWDAYRWGPVSTRDPASGLMDAEGYLHRGHQAVYDNATSAAVVAEVDAQIDKALAAGIDVTHVDSHMGTILNPLFIQAYLQAAAARQLPGMLPRLTAKGIEAMGVGEAEQSAYAPLMEMLESMGVPLLDGILSMPLEHDTDHIAVAKRLLGELPIGITHFILHPAIETPELRAICADWRARVANYNAFLSNDLKKFLEAEDFKLIGYRQIRDVL